MAAHYIVDGYNVIHYILTEAPNALRLSANDFELNRTALVEYLASYCSTTPVSMTIVFDGQGTKAQSSFPFGDRIPLEVTFAPTAHSADVIIQRTVFRSTAPGQIIVVTDDRGIRDLVGPKGALVMRPRNFLATLREMAEANKAMKMTNVNDQMEQVGERLDGDSLERLQRIRDSLSPKPEGPQTKKGL
jgi:predicted RNA-binding protein with PIN domain